jgi:DNA polymerase I-like protein with 3'-5' exonuclease and polymerase domains
MKLHRKNAPCLNYTLTKNHVKPTTKTRVIKKTGVQSLIYRQVKFRNDPKLKELCFIEMRHLKMLFKMEETGVPFDRSTADTLLKSWYEMSNNLEASFQRMVNNDSEIKKSKIVFEKPLNLDERDTVKHLLYAAGFKIDEETGDPSTPKRRKCKFCNAVCNIPKFSTSADSFDEFRRKMKLAENVLKIMKSVQDYRQLKRRIDEIEMMNTFVDSDSRIHYNTSFTETGRIQMEDPSLLTISNDCDINGITISPRTCIKVTEPSKILLSMDFKQIEQRVIAHVSDDKLLCQLLNDDKNDFFEVTAKKNPRKQ